MGLSAVYAHWSHDVHGGDKGTVHDYLPVYEQHMTRSTGATLLEIGVCFGHSIGMWREWLPGARVIGLDVDLSRLWFELPDVHEVDATSREQVDALLDDTTLDYVIDDGSHRLADQIASFTILWPRVKPGGVYFIEDIDGEVAAGVLQDLARINGADCVLYDGREQTKRWDELLLVARKP